MGKHHHHRSSRESESIASGGTSSRSGERDRDRKRARADSASSDGSSGRRRSSKREKHADSDDERKRDKADRRKHRHRKHRHHHRHDEAEEASEEEEEEEVSEAEDVSARRAAKRKNRAQSSKVVSRAKMSNRLNDMFSSVCEEAEAFSTGMMTANVSRERVHKLVRNYVNVAYRAGESEYAKLIEPEVISALVAMSDPEHDGGKARSEAEHVVTAFRAIKARLVSYWMKKAEEYEETAHDAGKLRVHLDKMRATEDEDKYARYEAEARARISKMKRRGGKAAEMAQKLLLVCLEDDVFEASYRNINGDEEDDEEEEEDDEEDDDYDSDEDLTDSDESDSASDATPPPPPKKRSAKAPEKPKKNRSPVSDRSSATPPSRTKLDSAQKLFHVDTNGDSGSVAKSTPPSTPKNAAASAPEVSTVRVVEYDGGSDDDDGTPKADAAARKPQVVDLDQEEELGMGL